MKPPDWRQPYPAQRAPVLAANAVATSQPLAAQAGLRMLLRGGNAVDAALATAIALTVVEPCSNGLGSDAFALVWDGAQLHGLNASGRAPRAWRPEHFAGLPQMPAHGWMAVTVPGAVSAWVALSRRFGKLPFGDLFAPAVAYARDGFLVSPIIARQWQGAVASLKDQPGFREAFMPGGRAPHAGERFRCPALAGSLEAIAATQGEAFYHGPLAAGLAAHAAAHGGLMTAADLAAHQADWVMPLAVPCDDLLLHELPPNGQGLAALLAMGLLGELGLGEFAPDSPDALHLQIEAMKLAFADVYHHVGDPATMPLPATRFLAPAYFAERARCVNPLRAEQPHHGLPPNGDTVYLTAADAAGMMVSYIQSNYGGFGSGVVVPGTGISLQNRGHGFVLTPGHPNQVGGGKRPFHTIIPAFVTAADGAPVMSFGVMGGPMQPQGHVQVLTRLATYGQNPQAALDAPRWRVLHGLSVGVEAGFPEATLKELARRGHHLTVMESGGFGGGQALLRLPDGYLAASDPRKDGQAVGY